MLLRRVMQHIREQNWFAVGLDFLIVVAGVYSAVWINDVRSRAAEREQTAEVIETLRNDLTHSAEVERSFVMAIDLGLDRWTAAYAAGERPPPYYFRVPGSDTAPRNTWETLLSMGVGDVFHPHLVFDLAFFFTEREGVGRRYVRYVEFVEREILPYHAADPSVFYLEDGRMRAEFAANMERLREYRLEAEALTVWGDCLNQRLDAAGEVRPPCSRDFVQAVTDAEAEKQETAP